MSEADSQIVGRRGIKGCRLPFIHGDARHHQLWGPPPKWGKASQSEGKGWGSESGCCGGFTGSLGPTFGGWVEWQKSAGACCFHPPAHG